LSLSLSLEPTRPAPDDPDPILTLACAHSPAGVCALRVQNLEVVYANPAYRRLVGLPPDGPLQGRLAAELVGRAALPLLAEVLRTGEPRSGRGIATHRPDGGTSHADWTVQPLADPGGVVMSLLLFVVDAGPRVEAVAQAQAQAQAQARAAEMQAVLETATDAAWVFAEGRCTQVNAAAARMVGEPPERMLGRTLRQLARRYRLTDLGGDPLPPQPTPDGREWPFPIRMVRPDRSMVVLWVSARPMRRQGRSTEDSAQGCPRQGRRADREPGGPQPEGLGGAAAAGACRGAVAREGAPVGRGRYPAPVTPAGLLEVDGRGGRPAAGTSGSDAPSPSARSAGRTAPSRAIWPDMVYFARDATAEWESRRVLVDALQESRRRAERWEAIVRHIPVGVQVWDAEGRLRDQNGRAAELLEGCPPDVAAEATRMGIAGGGAAAAPSPGGCVVQRDTVVVRPNGSERHLIVSSTPVWADDGQVGEVLTLLDDVTERRRMERAKDEFLALLAHELRNPLAVLQASAEAARRCLGRYDGDGRPPVQEPAIPAAQTRPGRDVGAADLGRARQHLGRAVGQAKRMGELLSTLLDAARLGVARPVLDRREMDLASLCREVAAETAAARGRVSAYVGPDAAMPVRADPQRVAQVLAHLVNNACKYSPCGARIEIAVERGAGEALVQVRDRGIGVPPGEERRIFDGFYRAGNVRGPSGPPGLGIGLHVARTLVTEHGGRIGVRPNPGGGSIFYFTLPLEEAPD